jgi:hypothetical protein
MIWVGITLVVVGGILFFRNEPFNGIPIYLAIIAFVLILNGLFLSFRVSPYLLLRENEGRASEILPDVWQKKIMVSLVFSDIGWWSGLALVVYYLLLI